VKPKPKGTTFAEGKPEGQQPTRKISGADLASYQFPVDDDEEHDGDAPDGPSTPQHMPSLHKQPSASALKKSPSDSSLKGSRPKKTPAFRERIEIINEHEQLPPSASTDTLGDTVHPSNMDFSDDVLQGRNVVFHTIPKVGCYI